MKRALIKITCYCEYRAETEKAIVEKQRLDEGLNLSLQLEQGYPAFLSGFAHGDKVADECVPHPFDTHPTLNNRLARLGFDARSALRDTGIQGPAANSWYHAIADRRQAKSMLCTICRNLLLLCPHALFHLSGRGPKDEEETAIVREHFPQVLSRRVPRGERGSCHPVRHVLRPA
jgi:hypothetical protein